MPELEILKTFIGPPLEDSFTPYVKNVTKAVTIYRDNYKKIGVFKTKVYPYIEELLANLIKQGYNLYITSSKNEPMIHVMLKYLGIDHYFTAVYDHIIDANSKIKVISTCLTSENIKPSDAIIIGDTKFDIIGGKNNDIKTLGVLWGFGQINDFVFYEADAICHKPQDILKVIETF